MDALFTISQAAKLLNVSARRVQQLIKTGRLLAEGEGRSRMVTRSAIDAYRSGVPVWLLQSEREGVAKEASVAVAEFEAEPLLADFLDQIRVSAAALDYAALPEPHQVEIEDAAAKLLQAMRKARDWQAKRRMIGL